MTFTEMLNGLMTVLQQQGHTPVGGQLAALQDTPRRWWKAIIEMTDGYKVDVPTLLAVQFDDVPSDEMVVLQGVPFTSLCEHHLMPFVGEATIGYLPAATRVVGLSKLARLVDAHARRLQVQERMTSDIVTDLMKHLQPLGAGCVVRATHSCMSCRGIRKQGASMVTSSLQGRFREPEVRAEFLALAR
jgi:GTP cyclohydrolase I